MPLHSVRVVAIHPEGTLGRLRYPLGGDRPSQTTRLALSVLLLQGRDMRGQHTPEWYFIAASPAPTGTGSPAPTYATHMPPRIQAKV